MKPRRISSKGAVEHGDADDKEFNEKEAKVQKWQMERLRQFVLFFFLLSVVAFVVGSQQQATHVRSQVTATVVAPVDLGPSEEQLQRNVDALDEKVRAHKQKPNMIMETDPEGMKLTKELQYATHHLLVKRYGRHVFRVRVDLIFPEVIVKADGLPTEDYLVIELAPIDLIPCSTYNFLEIARTWKTGTFHRNAHHVLQVQGQSGVKKRMPFQEYSPEFPHARGTTGYAGRPSGPEWYISIQDNTKNHGPGSQQKHNPYEADSLFGRVVHGLDTVVPRIHSTPQDGWLDKENRIEIPKMTILIQNDQKEWVPWTHNNGSGESLGASER